MAAAAPKSIKDILNADEQKNIKQVIVALAKAGVADDMIGFREVVITAMLSESVDVAVEQYRSMLGVLQQYELKLKDLYDPKAFDRAQKHFGMFCVCGNDKEGLGIMWITGKPVPVAEEQNSVLASFMYYLAVHSDADTLRRGITLVIDSSNRSDVKIGNEKKLRKTWFNLPLQAKRIFIVGAGFFKRMAINGLLRVVRLFKSGLEGVQFVQMEAVEQVVPEKSRPNYALSESERVASVHAFMQQRLSTFPNQIGAKNCLSQFA